MAGVASMKFLPCCGDLLYAASRKQSQLQLRPLNQQSVPGEWSSYLPPPVHVMPSAEDEDNEEEEWPEPQSLWPESEEQSQRNNVVDLLDKVMHEIQEIRFNTTSVAARAGQLPRVLCLLTRILHSR